LQTSALTSAAVAALGAGLPLSAVLAATEKGGAERVYRGGRIYTMNPLQPWAEAIAVSKGRIVAIGRNDDMKVFSGKKTKIEDLGGAFVVPGFHDTHCHPHFIFRDKVADRFAITVQDSQETVLKNLADYAKKHKEGWIVGGVWNPTKFKDGRLTAEMLEKAAPGRAVWLKDTTGHNAAASKKAMELAGITKDTPSPAGGYIEKGSDGTPTGYVSDNASGMIGGVVPGPPVEVYQKCIRQALDIMRSNGITAVGDMAGREPVHETYKSLDDSGELNLRVMLAVGMNSFGRNGDGSWEVHPQAFVERLAKYNSRLVDAHNLKFWADGTPAGFSSVMLDPYGPGAKKGADFYGETTWSKYDTENMLAYDNQGFRITVHTVGDGTTREVLDVFETIRKANPHNTVKHRLSHLYYVSDEDLQRMIRLNLNGELSPDIYYPNATNEIVNKVLSKKAADGALPAKRLFDSGLDIGFGSDWGSSGRGYDIPASIEALLTRKDPWGKHGDDVLATPDQVINLETALRMLTINGAKIMQDEHERGSLEVGKYADMVVLSENLFDLDKAGKWDSISDVKVVKTVFEGEASYEA
jgi:predicted amidohydrolase YtcJ